MIFQSHSPNSPAVDVLFNGVEMNYLSIQQVVMDLAENKHDMVKILMAGIPPKTVNDLDGVAVSISWNQGESGHEFRGYVTYVEPVFINHQGLVNNSPLQTAWIYCLGVSFDMHGKRTRTWEKPTLAKVVKDLATTYQFSYSIPIDSFEWPRLIQQGESDWSFLLRVADSLGYEVTLHGTHLHIFDRYKSLGRQISLHALKVPASNADAKPGPGQILNMVASIGRITPAGNSTTESITSLDNRGVITKTKEVKHDSSTGRPLSSRFHDELAVNVISPGQAQQIIKARTRTKFPYEATFELTGTAGVKPGGIVNLDGFTGRFDGLWYVSSVTHTLTFDKFFSEIKALKDSTNDDPYRVPPVAKVKEVPSSIFHDSSWKAVTQMAEVYG